MAAVVLLLVALLVGNADTPPSEPAGFVARGDGARSGVVSTTDVPPPAGIAWRTAVDLPPLSTPGTDVLGTTTVADGREFVVVHDPSPDGQRVTSHDAVTGELVATTMLPLGSQPYDLSLHGGLLAHRDLGSVTLVDVATGERRWRVEERLRDDTQLTVAGVVGVSAAASGIELLALSLEDGSPRWRTSLADDGRVSQLRATRDTLVVTGATPDAGPFLAAVEPEDGRVRWQLRSDDIPGAEGVALTTVELSDGIAAVAGVDRLLLVDLVDGTTRTIADDDPVSGPAVVTAVSETVVVRSDGLNSVTAYEPTTGERLWARPSPESPVLDIAVRDDLLAVRGTGGTTLLAAATGATLARLPPGRGAARVVLTADGGVPRLAGPGLVELAGVDGVRWAVPSVAVHLPDLATDAGTVAVTTPDGVQVHDVRDGARRWAHEAFSPDLVTAGSLTPPALREGRVFLAPPLTQPPERGGLLSLFADSGIVDWTRDDDRVVPRGTPVVDRDLVILPVGSQLLGFDRGTGRRALVAETTIARTDVAAAGGWLVATDAPRDGGDLWVGRRATRDQVFRAPIRTCAPPVLHEDVVVVVDHHGDIVARTLADGEQPWGERARGSACRPLSTTDDVLVALVDDVELLAVTLGDGETAWRLALPAHAAGAPVVAGDQLLVPTLGGEVVAYDLDGTAAPAGPAWRVDVGGIPAGAVAVDGETVMVVTREGELVGLR